MIDGFRFGSDTADAAVRRVRFGIHTIITDSPGGSLYTFLYYRGLTE
jgi:hypothetical protein